MYEANYDNYFTLFSCVLFEMCYNKFVRKTGGYPDDDLIRFKNKIHPYSMVKYSAFPNRQESI